MPVTAIIGAQWGDEGKGKITDLLAQESQFIVRATGGGNTGRTVVNEHGKIALHLVPAGIFNPNAVCIIGNGVALDIFSDRFFEGKGSMFTEIEVLGKLGVEVTSERLKISTRAHLVMPWHIWIDEAQEAQRGKKLIGTTKRGIGPCFTDKFARSGIRADELFDLDHFKTRFKAQYKEKIAILTKVYKMKDKYPGEQEVLRECLERRETILPFVAETQSILWEALEKGENVLLEGSQGALLDLDFGIEYPFVTSCDVTPTGLAHGSGIPLNKIQKIIGVVKVFETRVAAGPFPTEMPKEIAGPFREATGEFGATTGRPRRCGWLDLPLLKYVVQLTGINSIALTKIDALKFLDEFRICTAYRIGNEIFPAGHFLPLQNLEKVEPVYYKPIKSWGLDLGHCRSWDDLPLNARGIVELIENITSVRVEFVSLGPERDKIIIR